MNGCLGKLLLIITVITALFLGYPYFIKLIGYSAKEKTHTLETQAKILGKMVKQIGNKKVDDEIKDTNEEIKNTKENIKENFKGNDNTKNKETGK